jgi:hypothetical protein
MKMPFTVGIASVNSSYKTYFKNNLPRPGARYIIVDQNREASMGSITCSIAKPYLTIITCGERGLAKSRNRFLQHSVVGIGLFSDDDVVHPEGFDEIIAKAFSEHPGADIISFQIALPGGGLFKPYPSKPNWLNNLSIFKCSSVEIAFRIERIKETGLLFDERFGLKGRFPLGEETVFLHDALSKGLKVFYLPVPIVIHPKESSGAQHNELNILARGAEMARIFGRGFAIYNILWSIKKYREYKQFFPATKYLRTLFRGSFDYLSSYTGQKDQSIVP